MAMSQGAAQAQKLTKPARMREKRMAILRAALDLFETKGFDGTAVPEIAARAQVGTGTIYRYFATKEELVNALFRHWKSIFNEWVLAPLPEGLDARAAFHTYWVRCVSWLIEYPREARFLDLHHHSAYLDAESRALEGRYLETVAGFLDPAIEAGAVRPMPPLLFVALSWGTLLGLMKVADQSRTELTDDMFALAEERVWAALSR